MNTININKLIEYRTKHKGKNSKIEKKIHIIKESKREYHMNATRPT